MSFLFELDLAGLTDDRGRALATECRGTGGWPLTFIPGRVERRWFGLQKAYPPVLELPTADRHGPALAAGDQRDRDHLALRPEAAEALARTLVLVGEAFAAGFRFQATWSGSPVRHEVSTTVLALADLVRQSQLNEFTRYTVVPPLT